MPKRKARYGKCNSNSSNKAKKRRKNMDKGQPMVANNGQTQGKYKGMIQFFFNLTNIKENS